MRSSRSCVLAAAGALALLAPAAAHADPTPAQAAAELNTWRTEVGLGAVSTTTVAAWDTGCAHHDNYEHLNGDALTHTEDAAGAGYTADGATAASDSVLASAFGGISDAALLPGPTWDSAVFHRGLLLQPRLAQIGYDSTTFPGGTALSCLWLQNQGAEPASPRAIDNTRTTPALTLYPSPANGAYDVPTTFPAGTESPDPAGETGVPAGSTMGWLLNVEVNGPWPDGGFGYRVDAHDVTATLASDGTAAYVPVVVSECGPLGCGGPGGTADGLYFQGGFGIFPTQPLQANTTYRVVLSAGTVTDQAAHVDYPIPAGYSWCFSTGATYAESADCGAPTTAAEEVTHPNASTTPNATPPAPVIPVIPAPIAPVAPAKPSLKAVAPSTTGSKLTGLKSGRPALTLKLHTATGAAAIAKIAIKPPGGLAFATKARTLRGGIHVTSAGHKRGFTARLSRGALTLTLSSPATQLEVRISGSALHASRTLVRRAKAEHPKALAFSVTTTAGGLATKPKVTLAPK